MSDSPNPGSLGWMDLTVEDAAGVCDFYQRVVGFEIQNVSMGDYDDFCLVPSGTDAPVAGVCHARGSNADMPPVWMPYFVVQGLEQRLEEVTAAGGRVLREVRSAGGGRYSVISDPSGAICALYEG